MIRLVCLALALGLGAACSTLSTFEGARTLEPGQAQVATGISVQRGANPLSYSGIPIPQVELAGRVGISPDVDVGLRAYLLGAGMDVRYRFFHGERTHLAVAPGLYGFWIPFAGGAAGQGSADLRAPVRAEYELSRKLSVSGGPELILRDQWNSVTLAGTGTGLSSRLDVYAGGGARMELQVKRLVLGWSADAYAQPARAARPAWSAGADIGFRSAARGPSAATGTEGKVR